MTRCLPLHALSAPPRQAMEPQGWAPHNQQERDGLRDLAEAMQRQLSMLTKAVEELKDVSCRLRACRLCECA